ncbi:hypothetical protein [Absidia glauca]|uniref:Uncharacterized protein n=1 Tax=Absidia glauca TaxID=4829 RepID=A0A163MTE7_ABSGL|nr:hypothetical protein [Absidia glauca]
MTWPTGRKRTQSWQFYSTYLRRKCICTGDRDVQEDFYTRLGAHDGTPPPAMYPIWQHSIFSDPAYLELLQIEAQEHDPAHTLLQQCVAMHSRFQTPIGNKIIFCPRPMILLLLPLVITFLPPLSFSLLHGFKRANERANERTNERTNGTTTMHMTTPPLLHAAQKGSF